MAEIVNLRTARKRAARRAKDEAAARNRVQSGTPADLRRQADLQRQRLVRALDAHRLETPAEGERPERDDAPGQPGKPG